MSFENKGFQNSLNSRYDSMNDQPTNYNTQKLNTGTIKLNPVGLPDYNNYMVSPSAISGLYSNIKSGKIKSGEGKEKVKEAANNIADFFSNLFKGDEEKKEARKEKRSDRKEKRKARRYKRKGNKIVKVDDDGEETGEVVTNAAELKKAVKEINTPDSELPIDNVTGKEDLTANTNLPEFTIMSSKKDKSKYIYITLAIIIIAVLLYLKFKKK